MIKEIKKIKVFCVHVGARVCVCVFVRVCVCVCVCACVYVYVLSAFLSSFVFVTLLRTVSSKFQMGFKP